MGDVEHGNTCPHRTYVAGWVDRFVAQELTPVRELLAIIGQIITALTAIIVLLFATTAHPGLLFGALVQYSMTYWWPALPIWGFGWLLWRGGRLPWRAVIGLRTGGPGGVDRS